MSKSLTHNHALLLNEREQLDAKIRELETQLGDGIVTLIKQHQGFKIPYPLLCGAILEALTTLESSPDKHQQWQEQGEKFLRSMTLSTRSKRKAKTAPQQDLETENDHRRVA
ncbi:MAG: hypothetical protein K0M45_01630 [Candidatus Paracaedibacteraceae bacterium]|nr:hypothetical protein [Candidatus Paracaedibacteraceae bacterium]